MTIAKDFAAKASVAFVAAAMILSMIAPAAQAQSNEDLQTMINTLLAQIASLQSQVGQGGTSVASGVCPYTWTRDLSVGSTGADVMKLQQSLNADADTRVSASGAGSVGAETETFGPATAAAVSKFQVKYRSEILSPAGLVNPTGYFGASSRAKMNAICSGTTPTTPVDPTDPVTPGDEDEEDEDMGGLSGEASLDSFEVNDGDSTIEEGDADVVIGEITVEFTDGDASISRLDITLDAPSTAKPWDAFETISLWVDGEMVAEVDASDKDEYLSESAGEIRFSGLDIVAMEDEALDISVGASIQNNLDTEEKATWDLDVTAMRFFDADGVATTEDGAPVTDDTAQFEIQAAGTDEELKLSLSSSNPDSTDIVVDTDVDTNDVTIMVADLEAVDNDIEMTTVVVKVTTVATTTANVVDDIRVVIDGESFDAEPLGTLAAGKSQASTTGNFTWYLFDIDGDVTVSEDDTVAMEVVADLNDTNDAARYANGTTIKAEVTSVEKAYWVAEGAEDLATNQFKGTAVGDAHTLVAEGILVPVDGFESEVDTLGTNDTIGEFTLTFDVTAVEGDFYITESTGSTTAVVQGVKYSVDGGAAIISGSLTSTADEDTSGVFTVREGETETFTLVVTVDPVTTGTFRVSLDEVWYSSDTDGITGAEDYLPTPVSDFRTASQAVQGS